MSDLDTGDGVQDWLIREVNNTPLPSAAPLVAEAPPSTTQISVDSQNSFKALAEEAPLVESEAKYNKSGAKYSVGFFTSAGSMHGNDTYVDRNGKETYYNGDHGGVGVSIERCSSSPSSSVSYCQEASFIQVTDSFKNSNNFATLSASMRTDFNHAHGAVGVGLVVADNYDYKTVGRYTTLPIVTAEIGFEVAEGVDFYSEVSYKPNFGGGDVSVVAGTVGFKIGL